MSKFKKVTIEEWSSLLDREDLMLKKIWETDVTDSLPFVSFHHYLYCDTYLVRLAEIDGRYTTAPFTDSSDVLALQASELDVVQFSEDLKIEFGVETRLRINERFAKVINKDAMSPVAHDYLLDLTTPLLPRVRKTLRHILVRSLTGEIKQANDPKLIDEAYNLYIRHMRRVRNFALPKTLFLSLLRDGGELWTWQDNGQVSAMAVFIPHKTEVLYSLSAASHKAFLAHAPHHIVYTALEKYRKLGIEKASLGATGVGSSLEVFKRGWRGQEYNIWEVGTCRHGEQKQSRLRNLVGYVPLRFYPLLTTKIGKYFF